MVREVLVQNYLLLNDRAATVIWIRLETKTKPSRGLPLGASKGSSSSSSGVKQYSSSSELMVKMMEISCWSG